MPPKNPITGKEMCRECQGSGTVPWGEAMLKCVACGGTGKVKQISAKKSSPKNRG